MCYNTLNANLFVRYLKMKELIVKWYEKLDLPSAWLEKVKQAAEDFDPSPFENTDDPYLTLNNQDDKMLCLLYALYKCEDFFLTARKRNIPEDILLASLSEVKRYTLEYITMTKGEKIGILTINWIGKILKGNIYRLRCQACCRRQNGDHRQNAP